MKMLILRNKCCVFYLCFSRNPSLTGQEQIGVNGGGGDLESFKAEILSEMRREMQRMKSEIIDGMFSLFKCCKYS